MSLKQKFPEGYIALISTIILSALLLLITSQVAATTARYRTNILNTEFKVQSETLAEGCMNIAILRLAAGITTTGAFSIGENFCEIVSIDQTFPASEATIQIKAQYHLATTNIQAVVQPNDFSIISKRECIATC